MKATFGHLALNVSNIDFYGKLLEFFDYRVVERNSNRIGMSDGWSSLWIYRVDPSFQNRSFHRKALGINHLAFKVKTKGDVDRFYRDFLQPQALKILYGGPARYPKYTPRYYAVYFEDPDRIKLEVFYNPVGS